MSSVESEAAALSAVECKQKGNAALSAKDFPTAILWYTEAIKKEPTQHVFYSNRSAAYLSKGDKELALADAEKCIELKPDWPKGYGRKGTALHRLGQFREAIKAYEDGLKVAPEDAALKRGLQDLKNAGPQTPNPFDANMWGKLAMHPTFKEWLNDPSYVSTLQTLQSNPALAQNPQLMQGDQRILQTYLFLLGIPFQMDGGGATGSATSTATNDNKRKANADENKKKEEEVVELTEEEKAAKEKLDRANAVKAEGNELYKAKKFDEAIAKYEEACKVDPSQMLFIVNIAACYLEKGDYTECIQACEKAIEVGKEHRAPFKDIAKAYERIGMAHWKQKNYASAIEFIERAQAESSSDSRHKKLKKLAKIKAKSDALAYIDPEKAAAAKARGNEHFKEGKFPDAVNEYTEAIKRDPSNATYYCNRSAAYQKLMDFSRAKDDAEKAIELDATYVKAWSRKAACEVFGKEYHKAMESYQHILEIDSENAEAKSGLERVVRMINAGTGENDMERAKRGMADPEIQAILQDPMMQSILQDMQTKPGAFQKYMSDASVASRIEKLIAAGVLRTGK